jgi:hypothetical protein
MQDGKNFKQASLIYCLHILWTFAKPPPPHPTTTVPSPTLPGKVYSLLNRQATMCSYFFFWDLFAKLFTTVNESLLQANEHYRDHNIHKERQTLCEVKYQDDFTT